MDELKNAEMFRELEEAKSYLRSKTPVYVYSEKILRQSANEAFRTFSKAGTPYYALKANANPFLLRIIRDAGFGADAVSANEIALAKKVGFKNIMFSGVGKTKNELKFAIENRVQINAESEEEIAQIASIKKGIKIGIRINPNIAVHTHKYITTGRAINKFGIPLKYAERAFELARNFGLFPMRVHIHLGSQIFETEPYIKALKSALEFADTVKGIEEIDLGGGYGVGYKEEQADFPAEALVSQIEETAEVKDFALAFEPGRFVVTRSGALLAKVLYRKLYEKNFIVTDCGMNDFIRPALYNAYHRVMNLDRSAGREIVADIVGPVCESADFIAKERKIVLPEQGDLLAVMDTGAYGYAMSSNYNLRCKPEEYLITEKGSIRPIRKRICP